MGKHLKKFNEITEYDAFKGGMEYIEPNVSLIVNSNDVKYNQYVRMITYYVDGVKYECEEGTTWRYVAENLLPEYMYWIDTNETYFEVTDDFWIENAYQSKWIVKDSNKNDVLINDEIKNNDKIYILGDMTFYINEVPKYGINGMTFNELAEWKAIPSNDQCGGYFYCDDNKLKATYRDDDSPWCIGGGASFEYYYLMYDNDEYVQCNDVITPNYNYVRAAI